MNDLIDKNLLYLPSCQSPLALLPTNSATPISLSKNPTNTLSPPPTINQFTFIHRFKINILSNYSPPPIKTPDQKTNKLSASDIELKLAQKFPSKLNYSDFKSHHRRALKEKANTETALISASPQKKPQRKSFDKKSNHLNEPFISHPLYAKPALRYLDKLFRLHQVSLFN